MTKRPESSEPRPHVGVRTAAVPRAHGDTASHHAPRAQARCDARGYDPDAWRAADAASWAVPTMRAVLVLGYAVFLTSIAVGLVTRY